MHQTKRSRESTDLAPVHLAAAAIDIGAGLHWCLDVIMDEGCARNRLDHGPQNLAVLRHMALNLMRKDPTGRASLPGKFKIAAWNNNYLVSLLPVLKCD